MSESENERELLELSELDVEAVGLVRRAATGLPFFFIKSESGAPESVPQENDGGTDMSGEEGRDTKPVEEELEPEVTEEATEEPAEDYAEKLAQTEAKLEKFQAKLEEEHKARVKVEEAFAEERRKRRLAEFTDTARTYNLASEIEQFAADLMAIADHDPELYERWETRLRAWDEQMTQSGLFEQYTQAGGEAETGGGAFLQAVEKVRVERFADEQRHEGWTKAFEIVQEERPDLAAQYAKES
jgi:flagellar motility protein MotE (MotC chaperone)